MKTKTRGLLVLAIFTLSFLLYRSALSNGFTMDDRAVALAQFDDGQSNELVASLHAPTSYFTKHYWHGHKDSSPLYRPVTVYSYALTRAAFAAETEEEQAFAQHLVGVILHGLNAALVFLLLCQLGITSLPAFLAALLFSAHGVHSEAVSSIVGRAELLGFAFGASSALCLLHALQDSRATWQRSAKLVLGSILLFLALCSKESAVVWVVLPYLFLYVKRRQSVPSDHPGLTGKEVLRSCLYVLLPLALFLLLRYQVLSSLPVPEPTTHVANPLASVSARTRIPSAIWILTYAIGQAIFPLTLASDYGASVFPMLSSPLAPRSLVGLLLAASLLVLALRMLRKQSLVSCAILVFLGSYFLVSNLPFAIGTSYGERLLYTPVLGMCLLLAYLLREGRLQRVSVLLSLALIAGHAIQTLTRVPVWKDNATLFRHDAATQPKSARLALGVAMLEKEDSKEQEEGLIRAVKLNPSYPEALYNLASIAMRRNDHARAQSYLERITKQKGAELLRSNFDAFMGLASLSDSLGRKLQSFANIEKALACDPDRFLEHLDPLLQGWTRRGDNAFVYRILSLGYERQKGNPRSAARWLLYRGLHFSLQADWASCEKDLSKALSLLPDDPRWAQVAATLAHAKFQLGKRDEAIQALRALIKDPRSSPALRARLKKELQSLGIR